MAKECVDQAVEVTGMADEKGCQTDGYLLEGGDGWYPTLFIRLVQDYGLDVEVCLRHCHTSILTCLPYSQFVSRGSNFVYGATVNREIFFLRILR